MFPFKLVRQSQPQVKLRLEIELLEKVSIYNRTAEPITLDSGTDVISDSDNLIFTLDSEVTISSKSSDLISGEEKFGKATGVMVTAGRIGADYNISQNTNFTVDNTQKPFFMQ